MAVANPAVLITCSPEDGCFLTSTNREEILNLNCKVLQLHHRLQCCSTRAKGDSSAGFGEGEVTPQEMSSVLEALGNSTRKLLDEFKQHLPAQEVRVDRGRGMLATYNFVILLVSSSATALNSLPAFKANLKTHLFKQFFFLFGTTSVNPTLN